MFWCKKQWTNLNLDSVVNLGYIRSHGVISPTPTPWVISPTRLLGWQGLGGITRLQMMPLKWQFMREKQGSYCICRRKKKNTERYCGSKLTFEAVLHSCWYRLRAVKHRAMLGSPNSWGGEVSESLPQNMSQHLNCNDCTNKSSSKWHIYVSRIIKNKTYYSSFPLWLLLTSGVKNLLIASDQALQSALIQIFL